MIAPVPVHCFSITLNICPDVFVSDFTPCTEDQYRCQNEACIPHEQRCDVKFDCHDKSDELDCGEQPRNDKREGAMLSVFRGHFCIVLYCQNIHFALFMVSEVLVHEVNLKHL